ncbi:hypothetical protein PQX77_013890 [Marasmius sp. AFHP31]|nr:hypothetical protein PQX77_013890 [Marasmius sp. AFHP31]
MSTSLPIPMPIPGTRNAPHFNGKFVSDFLDRIKLHGGAAQISDNDKLVDYIYHYSSDQVKEYICYLPEFDLEIPGRTWDAASTQLKSMFASTDVKTMFTEDSLTSFAKSHAANYTFTLQKDVENYYLEFQQIAAPLVKKQQITGRRRDLIFTKGIPIDLWSWLTRALPEANHKVDNPPTMSASHKILLDKFDKNSLFFDAKEALKTPSYDAAGNRLESSKVSLFSRTPNVDRPFSSSPSPAAVDSNDSVEDLSKAFAELKLYKMAIRKLENQLQDSTRTQPGSSNICSQSARTPNPNTAFAANDRDDSNEPYCMICGLSDSTGLKHRLGAANCPDTSTLLADGYLIYDPDNSNYFLLSSGLRLPRGPRGVGVAGLIRKAKQRQVLKPQDHTRDNPPHVSSTQSGKFYMSGSTLDQAGVFGVSPVTYVANPVLRSGKNATNRFDPAKRPDNRSKGKARDTADSGPIPSTSVSPDDHRGTATPPQQKNNIPTPPNPINREDGWQCSLPAKNKQQDKDMLNLRPRS